MARQPRRLHRNISHYGLWKKAAFVKSSPRKSKEMDLFLWFSAWSFFSTFQFQNQFWIRSNFTTLLWFLIHFWTFQIVVAYLQKKKKRLFFFHWSRHRNDHGSALFGRDSVGERSRVESKCCSKHPQKMICHFLALKQHCCWKVSQSAVFWVFFFLATSRI